jgi:SAM-dependent methyltransferase
MPLRSSPNDEARQGRRRGGSGRDRVVPDAERWNHNIAYHDKLLRLVPAGARRGLDVGCGDGMLTRRLAASVEESIGIDLDEASIALAQNAAGPTNVAYVHGDVMTHPFELESFDVVVCVMALHHLDTDAGLRRMVALLRPGGFLGIIGAGRLDLRKDLPYEVAGAVVTRFHKLTKIYWEQPSPMVWPPPDTYAELEQKAKAVLPGADVRRRLLWRYTLTWVKPTGSISAREGGTPGRAADR